jgi:hypothetical protein
MLLSRVAPRALSALCVSTPRLAATVLARAMSGTADPSAAALIEVLQNEIDFEVGVHGCMCVLPNAAGGVRKATAPTLPLQLRTTSCVLSLCSCG